MQVPLNLRIEAQRFQTKLSSIGALPDVRKAEDHDDELLPTPPAEEVVSLRKDIYEIIRVRDVSLFLFRASCATVHPITSPSHFVMDAIPIISSTGFAMLRLTASIRRFLHFCAYCLLLTLRRLTFI